MTTMQPKARETLVELVQGHLSTLVRDAMAVQRHAKRARLHHTTHDPFSNPTTTSSSNATITNTTTTSTTTTTAVRRRLHAADINLALRNAGNEILYATAVVPPDPDDVHRKVVLHDFLRSTAERMPAPPTEVRIRQYWLAVNGNATADSRSSSGTSGPPRPSWMSQQQQQALTAAAATINNDDPSTNNPDATNAADPTHVRVHQLQSRLLSEELQLYFSRVTAAMERGSATAAARQQQDAVLYTVAHDAGLQELVPFFIRYVQQQLYQSCSRFEDRAAAEHGRTWVRLARALLHNPHLHLELHLHALLPALVTCIVAKQLPIHLHWPLRREAALAVWEACVLFGDAYATLQARVLRALCQAVQQPVPASRYGGIYAIALFGSRAIDAFLLPHILPLWTTWEEQLQSLSSPSTRDAASAAAASPKATVEEIQMCQQASLDALSIFLRQVSVEEKAARLDRNQLYDILGDRIIALEAVEDMNEYVTCFI